MQYKNYLLKIMIVVFGFVQLIQASDRSPVPQSKFPLLAKVAIGGTLGGILGYLLSKMDGHLDVEAHNKDLFLAELQGYINSNEYMNQQDAGRMFSHYYNGLTQLAHEKEGIGVSLLKEFSSAHDEETQQELIKKIQDLAAQIKNDYSRAKTISKYVSIIALALMGGMFAAATESEGTGSGNNYYGGVYMPASSAASKFFR